MTAWCSRPRWSRRSARGSRLRSAACTTSVPTCAAPDRRDARGRGAGRDRRNPESPGRSRSLAGEGGGTVSPAGRPAARAWASFPESRPPSRAAWTAGPRFWTPRAGDSPCSGARSPRSRAGSRRHSAGCSDRPRSSGSSGTRTSREWAITTSCPWRRTIAARFRGPSSGPAPPTRRFTSSRPRSRSSPPRSRISGPARPRRFDGSSAGSAPRSGWWPTRCSRRWPRWRSWT